MGNYEFLKELGKGAFATVYLARHRSSNRLFAIKQQARNQIDPNRKLKQLFDSELEILQKIDHPNLLKFYEMLKTANSYYLVLEYCKHGDLEQSIKKTYPDGKVPEAVAVKYLAQIVNGFRELTRKKIMHRDFKLANIFLDDDRVVIGDFGFAKEGFEENTTYLGTKLTMAPELLNAGTNCRYTNKADLWSVGVTYYKMLFGTYPWLTEKETELKIMIREKNGLKLPWTSGISHLLSTHSKDFLRRVLTEDPVQRISWGEVFKHPLVVNLLPPEQPQEEPCEQPQEKPSIPLPQVIPAAKTPKSPGMVGPTKNTPVDLPTMVDDAGVHQKHTSDWLLEVGLELRHTGLRHPEAVEKTVSARIVRVADALRLLGVRLWMQALGEARERAAAGTTQEKKTAEWLLRSMQRDEPLYKNLQAHLQSKLLEEIPDDQNSREVNRLSISPNTTVEELQKQLKLQTYWLLDFFSTSKTKFNAELKKELSIGIVHLYLSTHYDSSLPYKMPNGTTFDWPTFKLQIYEDKVVIEDTLAELVGI